MYIKPGRTESQFAFFIGLIFVTIGIVMVLAALLTPIPAVTTLPFGIFWMIISGFNTYRAYKNGFTEKGMAHYEIEMDDSDFDTKLRKLEMLKKDGLISQTEYQQKRNQIMSERW